MKYKNTDFYFDTKLVLRFLGYTSDFEQKYTQELVELLVNDYQANIKIFHHTYDEIKWAFQNAIEAINRKSEIFDTDMRLFIYTKQFDANDLQIELACLESRLKHKGIKVEQPIDWNEKDSKKFNLDWEKLQAFIKIQCPSWKERAIRNAPPPF